tara:strand:+ start:8601 stop:9275 length:675 start_codon:yes stop_codon:yes gene_type:complete
MVWRTSNATIANQITTQGASDFKAVNNLLTLQENHVEEFFQYHGEQFLAAMEKLFEDVVERVISQMLVKLKFVSNTNGDLEVHADALREYETITAENITLDLQQLLATAVNSEVIMQRRMAKSQYLEAQGFTGSSAPAMPQSNSTPPNIQGAPAMGGMNQQMQMQNQAFNNQSGYPIQPAGYDSYNNPYWIDPATGQPTYQAPTSGLNIVQNVQKLASWATWLA